MIAHLHGQQALSIHFCIIVGVVALLSTIHTSTRALSWWSQGVNMLFYCKQVFY